MQLKETSFFDPRTEQRLQCMCT